MERQDKFEYKALFELTVDCLRFNPNDRLRKESLIEHKFFHSALFQNSNSVVFRLQPHLNPIHDLVGHDPSKDSNAKITYKYIHIL